MLEEVAKLIGEKSAEIADRGLAEYGQAYPECSVDSETKTKLVQMVNSMLSFKLNELKINEAESIEDQVKNWLESGVEKDAQKGCVTFLVAEQKKRVEEDDENLDFLQRFLKRRVKK